MDANFDKNLVELKQAHAAGIVVGLQKFGGVKERLDVDVLLNEKPDTFNLFLIALSELQSEPKNNIMGYYQIAGERL
jgi:hypothetical protein